MLGQKCQIQGYNLDCANRLEVCAACHWCAGEGQGRSAGLGSASTSSLQHVHEEGMGMNGSSGFAHHPAHVRTASVADSADEAAQASGDLLNSVKSRVMLACTCCRNHA